MNTKIISDSEISSMKISSLPSRPTLTTQYGGRGYTSSDMKAAFDALPLYIIEKFNSLISDIKAPKEESICTEINTGIPQSPKLADMLDDILTGRFIEYLVSLDDEPLSVYLAKLRSDIDTIAQHIGVSL